MLRRLLYLLSQLGRKMYVMCIVCMTKWLSVILPPFAIFSANSLVHSITVVVTTPLYHRRLLHLLFREKINNFIRKYDIFLSITEAVSDRADRVNEKFVTHTDSIGFGPLFWVPFHWLQQFSSRDRPTVPLSSKYMLIIWWNEAQNTLLLVQSSREKTIKIYNLK